MVVLLDTLVVVADSSAGEGIHVIGVVHTVMIIVVAGAGDHHSDLVQMVEICKLNEPSLCENHISHLHHICSMQVVMISDIGSVAPLNLVQE